MTTTETPWEQIKAGMLERHYARKGMVIHAGPEGPETTSADRRQLLNPNSPQEWGL